MVRRQARCPNCEADVHPNAHECPECGTRLTPRRSPLPMIVGGAGVLVALAAGAAVWVLLDPGHKAPAPKVEASVPPPVQPAPAAPAPQTPAEPAPLPPPMPADNAVAPVTGPGVADTQLPLPMPSSDAAPAADEQARREFARTTQESFTKNGLDLKVTTSGAGAKVVTLAFNFPAKMAVELIAGGPFPRQCRQRGFTSIAFTDSNGGAWAYDIATDKLTGK